MASLQLLRHATVRLILGETTFLVDPMLADVGAAPPIQNTPNDRRNPLVPLPDVPLGHDALLVTHLHNDHLDDPAVERFAPDSNVLCSPVDADTIHERGFADVRAVNDSIEFDGLRVTCTPAQHGHGDLAAAMAPVAGFVLESDDGPTVYLAGDTVWYDGVAETLATHDPDVVVVNAGGARFTEGRPITMDESDVLAVCEHTDATVVAVHMEAINHCLLSRETLRDACENAGVGEQIVVPGDGETVTLD